MTNSPARPSITTDLDRVALGEALLQQGTRDLERLRRVRGAHKRTARRIRRALAVLALAAGLLGVPLAGVGWAVPPAPCFKSPYPLANVGSVATPELADIDGDGDLDAFVGVTSGNTVFFENTGTAAAPAFGAPQPSPFGLADVGENATPELADIDGDGDLDAFVGELYGNTFFFENTGTAAAPAFAAPQTSPFGLADVGYFASPELGDIDGDGDLDAFVGEAYGNTIFLENTGTAAAPAFGAPQTSPFGLADVGSFASPELGDIDGDGDLDAFVGETLGNTIFFENTGTALAPAFAASQTNPFGLTDVGTAASPALADIDGDGDLDALVGRRFENVILFENTGTAAAPAFLAPETSPFGLANVDALASPEFADIDGDGDLDAFVGAYGNTIFFANTGTAAAPAFAAPQTNPFGLANVGSHASPALADIDGDGDLDAFVGEQYGNTIFFANTGTAAAPAFAAPQTSPFGLVDVSLDASPALADIDGDGDLDAFVGEAYGNTIFFENTGTAAAPAFAAPQTSPFGLVDVGVGASPALADIDGDGDLDAFVGETYGNTIFFENTGTATAPAFAAPQTSPFGLGDVGLVASPALADIDGDGDLDAFVGEGYYGKTIFFENDCGLCPSAPATTCANTWQKGLLLIKESVPGKEKLIAKMIKGPALAQSDFGDPLQAGGNAYTTCVYDDAGALVGSMEVDRADQTCGTKDCWKPIGSPPPNGKGYLYKDSAASSDGITLIKLKGGDAGKSSVMIKGANNAAKGQVSLPVGLAAGLASSSSATVQLFGSDSPECVSLTVDDIKKQETDFFKATK